MKAEIWAGGIGIDVFRAEVIVIITNSKGYLYEDIENVLQDDLGIEKNIAKEFSKEIKRYLDDEEVLPPGVTLDIPCSTGGREVFVILDGTPKSIKDSVVVHEMYHATRNICRDRGVDDEETEAYMQEYLYDKFKEQVSDFLKSKKEK